MTLTPELLAARNALAQRFEKDPGVSMIDIGRGPSVRIHCRDEAPKGLPKIIRGFPVTVVIADYQLQR